MTRYTDDHLREAFTCDAYLLFDGAMGTMIQKTGLAGQPIPELHCVHDAAAITSIHRAYVQAGSEVVSTNTFGANRLKLEGHMTVAEAFHVAVACARNSGARYVAADVGPTGALLEPIGTLGFEEAYDIYAEVGRAIAATDADLVIIETMNDLLELKAALLAIKDNCELPVICSMTFGEDGRTFMGTDPQVATLTLDALGADAIGVNCSLGPDALSPIVDQIARWTSRPVLVQANAGLPRMVDGVTTYDIGPRGYADAVMGLVDRGASIIGGCCGTDPAYIELLAHDLLGRVPAHREVPACLSVTSAQKAVILDASRHDVAVIGERINPTGKPKLKAALASGDMDYVITEAIAQAEAGADILDVNVGVPGIDEVTTMVRATKRIASITDLPLQVDSSNPDAIEAAVRCYAGKPLINSVNGKRECLDAVLPIAKRYGCALVGLTLDEDGIPADAQGRFDIARAIVEAADAHGIPRQDIAIDCLCMTASTDQSQPRHILEAIRRVRAELGCHAVLGVSNISFGLPQRELVNSVFLAQAMAAGMDLAIVNPRSQRIMDVIATHRVLCAQDTGAANFIAFQGARKSPYAEVVELRSGGAQSSAGGMTGGGADGVTPATADATAEATTPRGRIRHAILTGSRAGVEADTRELLACMDPISVVNEAFIPVLDEVGALFEGGRFFLPQLLASAEVVKFGCDIVKEAAPADAALDKGTIVLATVKGDIHDIGKNIVKMLLENYGYKIIDLGRDVDPALVLQAVRANDCKLVGLSALMTTTVGAMEQTIALLHAEKPDVKVFVGGAVLNQEYAEAIHADYYARDAAASARIAAAFFA